jgi:hypothetical protein
VKHHRGEIKANLALLPPIFKILIGDLFTLGEIEDFFSLTVKAHNHLVRSTGVKQATETWKSISNYAIQLSEGRNPKRLFRVSTGRTDGWPKLFSHLRPIYHKLQNPVDPNVSTGQQAELRRLLLTLFKVNRVCYDFVELETAGLTTEFPIPKSVEERFTEFLNESIVPYKGYLDDLRATPFLGPAHGPNSKPKLESAPAEAYALTQSKLWRHFTN